ncbi:MAG: hypothetical protein LUG18_01735 [Candidatus Azobacteroides sp.]|nr:hypothetical protein [Candidatus Azobacteroides sp.]
MSCKPEVKPEVSETTEFQQNDTIGIGLLLKNISGKGVPLYLTKTDTVPFDVIKFIENQYEHIFVTDITTSYLKNRFSPYRARYGREAAEAVKINKEGVLFIPVYELAFRVVERKENCFGIIINEENKEVMYVRPRYWMDIKDFQGDRIHAEDPFFFISWENYLTTIPSISGYEGIIYSSPMVSEKDTMVFDSRKRYTGVKIKGNWLQIAEWTEETSKPTGYIPWTDGKKLNIEPVEWVTK